MNIMQSYENHVTVSNLTRRHFRQTAKPISHILLVGMSKSEFQIRFSDPTQDQYKDAPDYCLVELTPDVVELAKQGQEK